MCQNALSKKKLRLIVVKFTKMSIHARINQCSNHFEMVEWATGAKIFKFPSNLSYITIDMVSVHSVWYMNEWFSYGLYYLFSVSFQGKMDRSLWVMWSQPFSKIHMPIVQIT